MAAKRGTSFERLVAKKLSEAGVQTKRFFWQSSKEQKGCRPGVPDIGGDAPVWLELGDGAAGHGEKKLRQAIADLEKLYQRNPAVAGRLIPMAVTRSTGTRQILVTMTMADLLACISRCFELDLDAFVQIDLAHAITLLRGLAGAQLPDALDHEGSSSLETWLPPEVLKAVDHGPGHPTWEALSGTDAALAAAEWAVRHQGDSAADSAPERTPMPGPLNGESQLALPVDRS